MSQLIDTARAVGRHVGRRGAYLTWLALLDVVVGLALLRPPPLGLAPTVLYAAAVRWVPLGAWAVAWLAVGAAAAVGVLCHRARPTVFGCCALIKTLWGATYLAGWLAGMPAYSRGFLMAGVFYAFAGVTLLIAGWRENGT